MSHFAERKFKSRYRLYDMRRRLRSVFPSINWMIGGADSSYSDEYIRGSISSGSYIDIEEKGGGYSANLFFPKLPESEKIRLVEMLDKELLPAIEAKDIQS